MTREELEREARAQGFKLLPAGENATMTLRIRVTPEKHTRYVKAAQEIACTLSQFVTKACDDLADRIL